jgi:hypothetical protein
MKESLQIRNLVKALGYSNEKNPFNDPNLTSEVIVNKVPLDQDAIKAELMSLKPAGNRQTVEWALTEEQFHLEQLFLGSQIRIKEKRPKLIDYLSILFCLCNPDVLKELKPSLGLIKQNEPTAMLETSKGFEIQLLLTDIIEFENLEQDPTKKCFWQAMHTLADSHLAKIKNNNLGVLRSGVSLEVAKEIDQMLAQKSISELLNLESSVKMKLDSKAPIDTDYWQAVLEGIVFRKAKVQIRNIYIDLTNHWILDADVIEKSLPVNGYDPTMSPKIYPTVPNAESSLTILLEDADSAALQQARERVELEFRGKTKYTKANDLTDRMLQEDSFLKEASKDFQDNENIFNQDLKTSSTYSWRNKYRPRKPLFYNRVHSGYEWNRHNQLHYTKSNPPPQVAPFNVR